MTFSDVLVAYETYAQAEGKSESTGIARVKEFNKDRLDMHLNIQPILVPISCTYSSALLAIKQKAPSNLTFITSSHYRLSFRLSFAGSRPHLSASTNSTLLPVLSLATRDYLLY
ncbi:MAG: hypothetical protein JW732_05800 [Dehalococcoidia bacterium]|nr:hypothetical protein [Dehalococcoidia bacterium]